ncbi:unnamed protein product [Eruca vesicaria subsp. sativa]|uniref:UspA domain-containing protein n=1 Tax=Eruca vesicaria subsp. sativa TaxID=29727 RepID=A0ABC8KDL7_ERUVS|nr:unnamed protein product [Eruca vesicaria subsp. sativa]
MNPADSDHPHLPTIKIHHPSSPRHSHHHHHSTPTPTANARRKIGVAVDLSSESSFAVRWAVDHYIRPGDAVVLLHVSPTSVLFGADWGPQPPPSSATSQADFDAFTASKVSDLARPLKESGFPHKIHVVKDHDMRERLCLEIERLGLSAVIMGSRGFGAERKRGSDDDDDDDDGRLGSVSDYCVHHCVCPVVVVRYPDDGNDGGVVNGGGGAVVTVKSVRDDDDGGEERHEHIKG